MVENVLEEMKNEGFKAALVKKDGHLYKSNFPFEDPLPSVISSLLNTADAIFKQLKEEGQEYEIAFEDSLVVAIPVSDYFYLIGVLDGREQKKEFRKYISKIKPILK